MCSPGNNIIPEHLMSRQLVEQNLHLTIDQAVQMARFLYADWFEEQYKDEKESQRPSFDDWAESQDKHIRGLWEVAHSETVNA